jgi:hypothetical protein
VGSTNGLEVKSKTIEQTYREYINQKYSVNRRYQRKLVWTIDEKQRLIDSILQRYPLPQFLVAQTNAERDSYEIIDGMQRLNAIIGFVENDFCTKDGEYFDLKTTATTKELLDAGTLTQREPILSREQSVAIATYEIAQSVYSASDKSSIEEVFRRINSTGQKLSRQDLRQAGSTSPIADLVRSISSKIRGDSSPSDILPLADMKIISISSTGAGNYGIDVDQIFWVKRGILDRTSVRSSSDEQLVLDIVSDILFDPVLSTSTPVRNGLFQAPAPKLSIEVAEKIRQQLDDPSWQSGTKGEVVTRQYLEVHNRVDDILSSIPTGETFKKHIGLTGSNPAPRYFEAFFSAVYRIMYKRGKDLSSAETAAELLRGAKLSEAMPSGGGEWPADKKEAIIDDLTNKLIHAFGNHFEEGARGKDPIIAITGSEFTILLNEILLESSSVDVKQGFLPLTTRQRTLKNGSFTNIMKTLSAISNTHPKSGGRVFVGIADSAQDVQRVKEIDDVEAVRYQSLQIVGITREAKYLEMDINKYWDSIMRKIQSCSDLPEQYRLDIIRNSQIAAEGTPSSKSDSKYVLILAAPPTRDPISYKDGYYERVGTSTERVSDLVSFGRRFG